ncbi:MAG: hypothetical protein JW812_00775, partial [Alphaproteobacteria bacterium]|nr:hypothetical protein [Alphaproteobacteria bacterium]
MKKILFFICGMTMMSSVKAFDLSGTIADTDATTHLSTPDFYDLTGGTTLTSVGTTATLQGIALNPADYINLNGNTLNSATTTVALVDTEIRGNGTLNVQNITLTDSVIDFNNTTWTNSNLYTLTFQGTSSYSDIDNGLSINILETNSTAAIADGTISVSGDFTANTIQDTGANDAFISIDAANITVSTINLDDATGLTLEGQAIKVDNFTKTGGYVDLSLDSLNSVVTPGNINWTNILSNIENPSGDPIDLYTATTNISGAYITFYSDANLHNTATLNLTGSSILFGGGETLVIDGTTRIGDSAAPTNFEDG